MEAYNRRANKRRSASYQAGSAMWIDENTDSSKEDKDIMQPLVEESKELENQSPLVVNRALYRRHREMRMAVLDASKQFDTARKSRQQKEKAGLVMKRGAKPPIEIQDQHNRAMFEAAAKRCGRAKRSRNKTVSDVTGMMMAGGST